MTYWLLLLIPYSIQSLRTLLGQRQKHTEPSLWHTAPWVDDHRELYQTDKKDFYDQMIAQFYRLTEEPYGQHFWTVSLFTPFKEGTDDYEEWYDDFSDEEFTDLTEIIKVTGDKTPDLIQFVLYLWTIQTIYT